MLHAPGGASSISFGDEGVTVNTQPARPGKAQMGAAAQQSSVSFGNYGGEANMFAVPVPPGFGGRRLG